MVNQHRDMGKLKYIPCDKKNDSYAPIDAMRNVGNVWYSCKEVSKWITKQESVLLFQKIFLIFTLILNSHDAMYKSLV